MKEYPNSARNFRKDFIRNFIRRGETSSHATRGQAAEPNGRPVTAKGTGGKGKGEGKKFSAESGSGWKFGIRRNRQSRDAVNLPCTSAHPLSSAYYLHDFCIFLRLIFTAFIRLGGLLNTRAAAQGSQSLYLWFAN